MRRTDLRAYESLQERTLERLKARIPAACPLRVERRAVDEARRTFVGFRAVAPGCEQVGRAAIVASFIDGYIAAWEQERCPCGNLWGRGEPPLVGCPHCERP